MNDSESEFQRIYRAFQPKIHRYMVRLVGEYEAEDLTQEVFVKVNKALESFRGESKLSTWIYRIATNAAMDRLRSPSFQKESSHKSIGPGEGEVGDEDAGTGKKKLSVELQLFRKEMNECLRSVIDNLPENYRSVLVLIELQEFSNKDVAEILGISLGTVKIRIHRARKKLKEELILHCDSSWIEENEFVPDLKKALGEFRETDQV
jgi:RNA polymerase sigma-70 factor (ECF subfamily)